MTGIYTLALLPCPPWVLFHYTKERQERLLL